MNYGLGLSEKKKARERRNKFFKFLFYICLLGGAGAYGYFEGQSEADRRVANYQDQLDILAQENTNLNEKIRAAMDKQSAALTEARAWRDRFEKEIPTGPTLEILDLVRARMEDGVDATRLLNVISLVQNKSRCDENPETKRFIVNTPIYQSPDNSISLGNGTVTVTGDGEPTLNEEGKPEAWYDPTKAVTITFTQLGGRSEKLEGLLPIQKSLVFGTNEYRFNIVKGRQSFASITVTRCDFP
ncbi:hypothetical protein [Sneathiella glossodoripedis]|uniref:hypothetical protein n=1 Tax=Sneathiella glossodoripedis TaxID=418853 RepID=UPI00046EEA0C|nr:hypothetical protein [Sneathiella glossodoripedis]